MKTLYYIIRDLRILALLAVALGVSQAQTVSSGGCLYLASEGPSPPCPISYSISMTTNGTTIDTYASGGADIDDPYFMDDPYVDVEINLRVYGPGVLDSASDDGEVELDDNLPPNAVGTYVAVAYVEACEGYDGEVVPAEAGPGGCTSGSAEVRIFASVPNVTSVDPNSVTLGTSGTLTLTGNNFIDTFQDIPSLVSNSGIQLTLGAVSNTQATVSYNATGASGGQFVIGLTGLFGQGTQQTFAVVDPTPTVSSVSPSAWNSGTTTPITIHGSGFGTNPSLNIMGPGVTGYSIIGVSDTQISATVTVAPLVVGQIATVEVQSNGYGGSGFLGSPGQSPSAFAMASILPSVPTPQILFFGVPITGPLSVVAGQEISLSVQQPADLLTAVSGTFSSASFSPFSIQVAINGWKPSTAQGSAPTYTTNTSATPTGTSGTPFIFYWISGGTFTVDYQWIVQDAVLGQASGSTTITFIVTAPGIAITVNGGLAANGSSQIIPETFGLLDRTNGEPNLTISGIPCCGPSVDIGHVGISFGPSAQGEGTPGTYSWVQLISSDTTRLLTGNGPVTCTAVPKADYVKTFPYLDHAYPYPIVEPTTQTAHDNPTLGLSPTDGQAWGEASRVFSATMFLLWKPANGDSCISAAGSDANLLAACAVPVPQGFVNWGVGSDATNTLLPTQMNTTFTPPTISTWVIDLDRCSNFGYQSGFTPSLAYPTWTTVASNSNIACN